MGVVYKAQDLKLDRHVALKFLPRHLTNQETAKRRFILEAKAASALQHHNICTIHGIDETPDGQLFICMDYYQGETLKDKIATGPLPIGQVVDMVTQVTEGLAKAHEAGMVHRDVKPANLMVTEDGVVKILDFGLAKLAGQTKVTKTGTTVGTVAYMSPEQARGQELDHRSDIFSLGAVLYELLAGQPPFKAAHDAAVTYRIIHTEPEALDTYRPDVPDVLTRVVETALQKEVDARYQGATEVLADLKLLQNGTSPGAPTRTRKRRAIRRHVIAVGVSLSLLIAGYIGVTRYVIPLWRGTPSERKMLAVLPFENLGPAEDDYFADGITEEITFRLAGIRELGVIARTSVMQYKNTDKDIQQIGEELGVDYVLEGTVRWQRAQGEPDQARITPQLIRVSNATHLWAGRYDGVLTEVFQVQSDIAEKVASALNITLLEPERRLIASKLTDNVEALDYYLRGNEYSRRGVTHPNASRLAATLYGKAVALDSSFALAYAKLSRVHTELYWHAEREPEDLAKAKQAVDKAIELSPDLPDARVSLGSYYYHNKEYDRALLEFDHAREFQPSNSDLLAEIGYVQRRLGRYGQAAANLETAAKLDPRNAVLAINVGNTYLRMREYRKAQIYYGRAISHNPDEDLAYERSALLIMMRDGDVTAARHLLQMVSQLAEPTPRFRRTSAWIDACAGDYQAALEKLTIEDPSSPGTILYERAATYGLLNMPELQRAHYDSARVILEQAVAADPENGGHHVGLGIAYAGLGLKTDAIREGELAMQLAPISQDAHWNPAIAISLARIYVMVAEYDAAIDRIEYLLSIPAELSIPMLRIDPTWAPLRELPRFQKLLHG